MPFFSPTALWLRQMAHALSFAFWATSDVHRKNKNNVLSHTAYRLRELTGLDSWISIAFPEILLKCMVSKIGMGSKIAFKITRNGKISHSIFLKLYNLHPFLLSSFCIQCANKNSHAFNK